MSKSKIAWHTFYSPFNVTAQKEWKSLDVEWPSVETNHPNIDIWKIGKSMVAGTETVNLGYTFDIPTADNFRPFPFNDTTSILYGQLQPMHMPIHERIDTETGLLWASVNAINMTAQPPSFHQVIYTVDPLGRRTVQGVFNYSPVDMSKCGDDGTYADTNVLFPRYMHSISSSQNYIILPLTSSVLSVCKILTGAIGFIPDTTVFKPIDSWMFKFDKQAQMTFLLFDKRTKQFLEPISSQAVELVTHQFNAYEIGKNQIVADMIAFDRDTYDTIYVETLLGSDALTAMNGRALRYTIDLDKKTVTNSSLLPDSISLEFSQINRNFEGKPYKYGYVVNGPFLAGNQILKIDVDTPSGQNNLKFKPASDTISLSEPFFVQKPGTKGEDEGVLVLRGLDTSINKSRVYVIDAKTMEQVGEIIAPTLVPFGFHERFYQKESLGIKSSTGSGFFNIFS
jgi:hypothetical protein